MITFKQLELVMQLKACQTCSIFACRRTTFKISIQDGTKFYLEQVSQSPLENVLESLYKMKFEGSEQLQTELALYNQELNRDEVTPSYQRMRTMARQHVDQMIRTRNFKAWNERFETGALVKSHKGRNVGVGRKVGECFQWRATGQCSKGDSCSFNHGSYSGQGAQSSSSTLRAPTQTDGRKPERNGSPRGASPSGFKGKRARKFCLKKMRGTVLWFMAPSRMPKV